MLPIMSQGHVCDLRSFWTRSHRRVAALAPGAAGAWRREPELTCCLPREHEGCLVSKKEKKRRKTSQDLVLWCKNPNRGYVSVASEHCSKLGRTSRAGLWTGSAAGGDMRHFFLFFWNCFWFYFLVSIWFWVFFFFPWCGFLFVQGFFMVVLLCFV